MEEENIITVEPIEEEEAPVAEGPDSDKFNKLLTGDRRKYKLCGMIKDG